MGKVSIPEPGYSWACPWTCVAERCLGEISETSFQIIFFNFFYICTHLAKFINNPLLP